MISVFLLLQVEYVDFEMVSWYVHLTSRNRWSVFGWFTRTSMLKVFLVLFACPHTQKLALYGKAYKLVWILINEVQAEHYGILMTFSALLRSSRWINIVKQSGGRLYKNCLNFNQKKFKSTLVGKRKQLKETMGFSKTALFLITYIYSLGILLNMSLNLLALKGFCKSYVFS